ncbi:MAG: PKD domain-containing protein [Bacteroidota bacterium]
MKRLLLLTSILGLLAFTTNAQVGVLNCVENSLITGTANCAVVDSVYGCDATVYNCADDAMYNHGITHFTYDDYPYITSNLPCHVDFTVSESAGVYSFMDSVGNSMSGAPSYSWDFGDGTTSTDQFSTSHTFTTSGFYLVCATIDDNSGSCISKSCRVVLASSGGACTANFADSTICGVTTFYDYSSGTGYLVDWDFGDLSTIGNQPPGNITHNYAASGSYQVHMFIHDAGGSCNSGMTDSVTVVVPTVSAGFTYTTTGSPTDIVTFTNTSTGATTYYWDLGDGDTSSATNPVHDYDTCSYQVQLVAYDNNGCPSVPFEQIINACDVGVYSAPSVLNSLSVYPNPAKEDITVVLNSRTASDVTLSLKDVTGRQVVELKSIHIHGGENNYKLTLPTLPAGVYLLQVKDEIGMMNKSVLVR